MSKFKVGDRIIGTKNNDYGITNQYNECIVVGFENDIFGGEDLLMVKLTNSKNNTVFPVREEYFKFSGKNCEVELIWKKYNSCKSLILGII